MSLDCVTLLGIAIGFGMVAFATLIGVLLVMARQEDRFYADRWNGRLG